MGNQNTKPGNPQAEKTAEDFLFSKGRPRIPKRAVDMGNGRYARKTEAMEGYIAWISARGGAA